MIAIPMPSIVARDVLWLKFAAESCLKRAFAHSGHCRHHPVVRAVCAYAHPGPLLKAVPLHVCAHFLRMSQSQAETGYGPHLVKLCVTGSLISTLLSGAKHQRRSPFLTSYANTSLRSPNTMLQGASLCKQLCWCTSIEAGAVFAVFLPYLHDYMLGCCIIV